MRRKLPFEILSNADIRRQVASQRTLSSGITLTTVLTVEKQSTHWRICEYSTADSIRSSWHYHTLLSAKKALGQWLKSEEDNPSGWLSADGDAYRSDPSSTWPVGGDALITGALSAP